MNNLFKFSGRKRIKDRGIKWEPTYHERSQRLKDRFEKDLGPNAYIRWEGHDYTTNSDYFVVVGPAKKRYGELAFFAGIKKLPPHYEHKKVYAPSGKYFSSLLAALSHASQTWGVMFPPGQTNMTLADLAGKNIPRRVKA